MNIFCVLTEFSILKFMLTTPEALIERCDCSLLMNMYNCWCSSLVEIRVENSNKTCNMPLL